MSEGYNPFPGIIQAASRCELQNTVTDGLDEGCLARITPDDDDRNGWFYYRYYALRDGEASPQIDGYFVLSTYNGPEAKFRENGDFAWRTVSCPDQGPAHSDLGPGRWILTNIQDLDW
jgi:hypothetical protein